MPRNLVATVVAVVSAKRNNPLDGCCDLRNYQRMSNPDLKSLLESRSLRMVDLARAAKVDKATVTRWAQKRVPAERVLDVERITGIPCHELRPDIYPAERVAS